MRKAYNRIEYKNGDVIGDCVYLHESEPSGTRKDRRAMFKCRCGNYFIAHINNVKKGHTTSCGCQMIIAIKKASITHGMARTPIYNIWKLMIRRCEKEYLRGYKNYGGSGVSVCERWRHSFENFYKDMGERPSKDHSIDRYPNKKGNYEPSNCRWATRVQQARNRSITLEVTHNGETKSIAEWSELYNIPYDTLKHRLKSGRYTIDKCFNTPVGKMNNK